MDRTQRITSRRLSASRHLRETADMIDKAIAHAGVPEAEKETFVSWAIESMWNNFKEERMNRRILIENEVRSLGLRFPNGTVGKEYSVSFHLPADRIANVSLIGADELGLHLTCDTVGNCSLSGRPLTPGDFTLRLRYNTIDGEPASELPLPIAFNPNPRSLWRNLPTHADIPYPKPDSDCGSVFVSMTGEGKGCKNVVAASQRGRSHAQEGRPRDDHFEVCHCEESDWYILAVADGAGSARYSRKGSQIACKTVIDHCRRMLTDNRKFESAIRDYEADRDNHQKRTALTSHVIETVYQGARKAHDAIKQLITAEEGLKVKDFATTLMFAICKKFDFGWFIASFWVGDGAMGILDRDRKSIKLLGSPDEGEFSGQTRFLTMPEIFHDPECMQKRLRMAFVPDFTALFLMTDGVSDPMFETDRNLNDYAKWEAFYRRILTGFPDDGIAGVDLSADNKSVKEQLLGWLDFWSPGNHDDRTIAILY